MKSELISTVLILLRSLESSRINLHFYCSNLQNIMPSTVPGSQKGIVSVLIA